MQIPTLYLFESSDRALLAVAIDKTGCSIPMRSDSGAWLLRRQINPDELPAKILLTAYKQGFCMLNEDQPDSGTDFEPVR
jgi:hypothetical protein